MSSYFSVIMLLLYWCDVVILNIEYYLFMIFFIMQILPETTLYACTYLYLCILIGMYDTL